MLSTVDQELQNFRAFLARSSTKIAPRNSKMVEINPETDPIQCRALLTPGDSTPRTELKSNWKLANNYHLSHRMTLPPVSACVSTERNISSSSTRIAR